MKNLKCLAAFCLLAITFSNQSCVPQKKYDLLLSSKDALQKEYMLLQDARRERNQTADSLARTNARLAAALAEGDDFKSRYLSFYQQNEDLKKEIATVRQQNERLQTAATQTDVALRKEISDRMKELDAREKDLRLLESSLQTKEGTIDDLRKVLSQNELKIKELSDALKAKDAQMAEIQQKIADVLRGFNANELTVRQENGRIYVALSEALLFARGRADVAVRGAEAIRKLASALNASPDVDIEVEGHTDTDGSADLNWQLSTARAVSVAKILVAAKVEPKRIAAAGRAFYRPVAPNDVEANKAKNRRTEIVLSPRLDELYNLFKNK